MGYTTLTSWPLLIWRALDSYGIEPAAIFRQVGLDPALVTQAGARYPYAKIAELWKLTEESCTESDLPVRIAGFWRPTSFHALGVSWSASSTLFDALERFVRYSQMVTDVGLFSLKKTPDEIQLVGQAATGTAKVPRLAQEALLCTLMHMCRLIETESLKPSRAALPAADSPRDKSLKDYLGVAVQWGAPAGMLAIHREHAEAQLPSANPELALHSDQMINRYLSRLNSDDITTAVRAHIVERLPSGDINEDTIAAALNISRRSLQRRLAAENSSYKTILNHTRRELARHYLQDTEHSILDISFLLGFSETSSFSRAFRQWTGVSPSAWRSAIGSSFRH